MKLLSRKSLVSGLVIILAVGVVTGANALGASNRHVTTVKPSVVKSLQAQTTESTTPTVEDSQSKTTTTEAVQTTSTDSTDTTPAPQPVNPFQEGFNAWYVFNRSQEVGVTMPPLVGNANILQHYCVNLLNNNHYPTTTEPKMHGFACTHGQIVFIETINNDGSIWISEMNGYGQKSMTDSTPYGGWYKVDYQLVQTSDFSKYQFFN